MKTTMFAILVSAGTAAAAVAPLSPEGLLKHATHVVSGEAVEVSSKIKGVGIRDRHFEVTIEVESVEKGKGVKKGDRIVVHAWQPTAGLVPRPPGPQGHSDVPKRGGRVKMFLRKDGDAYQVIMPNGIKPLPADRADKKP